MCIDAIASRSRGAELGRGHGEPPCSQRLDLAMGCITRAKCKKRTQTGNINEFNAAVMKRVYGPIRT
jgi:hypothetical protein